MRRLSVFVPVLLWALSWTSAGYGQERQIFVLNPGWNLIAFQVLPASCPAGDARDVFSRMAATDGSGRRLLDAVGEPVRLFDRENPARSPLRAALVLEEVRTAEQNGGVSVTWRSLEPALPAEILRGIPLPEGFLGDRSIDGVGVHRIGDVLRCVAFAEAYLILVEGILPGAEYEVVGETSATVPRVDVGRGWNLTGLPFDVTVGEDDELHIASMFPEGNLTTIRRIVGWDSAIQEYRSYFPDDPELSDLRSSDPNVGYWIEAADAFALAPDLTITGPAAEDARVFIAAHETASRIPFYNAGGGAVGWSAELKPFSGPVPEGSVALESADAVNDVLSLSVGPVAQGSVPPIGPVARGLAVGETRYVEVLANRTHLPPATYVAHLDLASVREDRRLYRRGGGGRPDWTVGRTYRDRYGQRPAQCGARHRRLSARQFRRVGAVAWLYRQPADSVVGVGRALPWFNARFETIRRLAAGFPAALRSRGRNDAAAGRREPLSVRGLSGRPWRRRRVRAHGSNDGIEISDERRG